MDRIRLVGWCVGYLFQIYLLRLYMQEIEGRSLDSLVMAKKKI